MIDPAIRQIQRIENMPKESFVLFGDSSKPGLYLQYQRRAPNNWSRPHYHPIDRVVMVMGGTMRIGTDTSGDPARTVGSAEGRIHPRYRARRPLRRVRERSDVDSDCRRRAHGDYQRRPAEVAPATPSDALANLLFPRVVLDPGLVGSMCLLERVPQVHQRDIALVAGVFLIEVDGPLRHGPETRGRASWPQARHR